jgi:dihydrofolate synthase/folylpolyglutamate synthase
MTYSETLKYLYDKLPMFTRIGAAAIKKDVDNTLVLCEHLGNPQEKYKTIHVGGTNGKGSTSHMLAAILQQAGYKTGLYTSPHLKDFRERIRVNGEMMSESFVVSFTEGEKEHIEEIDPSFFEVTVAMAFAYFAEEKVDVAVVEVGLGGRLDSTNIIMPELSVITNISFDHMNVLGNTLQEIAWEKAGIIKKGIPVVIGEKQEESAPTFISKAADTSSKLVFANTDLHVADTIKDGTQLVTSVYKNDLCIVKDIRLDLTGSYQLKNLLTVIEAVLVLNQRGFSIPDEAVYSGLANTVEITGLQGRWQTLGQNPLVICDTGHNMAGIQEVLQNIQATPHKHLHMVIGMLKDKDVMSVLRLLPDTATYYFCQPILERALPAAELAQQAERFNLKGEIFNTVTLALDAARHHAGPDDLIFVGGSTFVVAEAI